MSELNLNSTVGQWVAECPSTSRVFQQHKMDFCCGGGVALAEACEKKEVDPQLVLAELLEARDRGVDSDETDWTTAPLSDLCKHIVQTHHEFLRTELPRLEKMAQRVAKVHGDLHPEVVEVRDVYAELKAELEPHMMKEENVLFPAIMQLEQATSKVNFPFGTVENPIRMMMHEHDAAGVCIARIRELTSQFEPPEGACNTYRALFDGLHDLEKDLHIHIHKENNILFIRAAQLESQLAMIQSPT